MRILIFSACEKIIQKVYMKPSRSNGQHTIESDTNFCSPVSVKNIQLPAKEVNASPVKMNVSCFI